MIEPDAQRVILVWRASMQIKKSAHEMAEIHVGACTAGELRARRTGKAHLRSLGQLDRIR